jgi:hypothetical protein
MNWKERFRKILLPQNRADWILLRWLIGLLALYYLIRLFILIMS